MAEWNGPACSSCNGTGVYPYRPASGEVTWGPCAACAGHGREPGPPVPLWLLDVDGVVNACCEGVPVGYVRTLVTVREHRLGVTYRPALRDRIRDLHTSGRVEVVWLTTWLDDALVLGHQLGLPEFTVEGHAEYDAHRGGETLRQWWKATTARRLCDAEPGRPLVWIDDDLDYAERLGIELGWAAQGRAHLLLSPDPVTGLTDKHLDAVDAFVDAAGHG